MKKIINFALIIIGFIFSCNNVLAFTEPKDINYKETLETFNNPERGFYEPLGLNLKPTNNNAINYSSNLVHLRVNLGDFSGVINGKEDLELTDDALTALNTTLQNIKAGGGSVIIRFAYDFDGKSDIEPSLTMILRHIEQLKEVFYKNKEIINYVELGFFGPWGEMHTSKISTTENVSKAIDKMLEVVPKEISIGVRTPRYYAAWVGVEISKLDSFNPSKNSKYYRVGLFNDGYLGSESDLGTFNNRDKEVAWLNNQAKHTLYGGEVVANFGETPINTVEYMSKEAFLTHTTYLNLRWNYEVIDNWNKEIYNGKDSLYVGQTGFKYIDNHLGYRFVLRKSTLKDTITNKDSLDINFSIENVGFANLINNKKVTIVLENEENIYEIKTNINPTLWDSNTIVNVKNSIKLPNNIVPGDYRVYLRMSYYGNLTSDKNYKTIRLANEDIWNSEIGANYIGKINITKYVPPKEENPVVVKPNDAVDKPVDDTNNKEENNKQPESDNKNDEIVEIIPSEQNVNNNEENVIKKEKNENNMKLYVVGTLLGVIVISLIIILIKKILYKKSITKSQNNI